MSYIHGMNISGLNLNLLPVLDALLAERSVSRAGGIPVVHGGEDVNRVPG